jgi:hypothetical protein
MFAPMIRLDAADVRSDPYPHAVVRDAVDAELFAQMQEEWPDPVYWEGLQRKMGGRNNISLTQADPDAFLGQAPAWAKFFAYLNTEAFVRQAVEAYRDHFIRWECKVDPDKMIFSDRFGPDNADNVLSIDCELARAQNGYMRTPHHDMGHRLMAFLLYLNGRDDIGGTGGTLDIHRMTQDMPLRERPREPKDTETVAVYEPIPNLMLSFLNTKMAYHSVPKMEGCANFRRFVYLGINAGYKGACAW